MLKGEPAAGRFLGGCWNPTWNVYARRSAKGLVLVNPTAAHQTVTLLGDVEVDAVRFDDELRGFVHASLSKLTRIHSLKGVGDSPVII